jgi:hypothetical protein
MVINGLTSFNLYPGQQCFVYNDNNVWKVKDYNPRWRLTGSLTIFVDQTNGSDSNDGLASGSGNAFQTWTAAYSLINKNLDFNNNAVTVQYASGQTITTPIVMNHGWIGGGLLTIDLGTSTLNPTSPTFGSAVYASTTGAGPFTVQNGTIATTTSGGGIHATSGAIINLGSSITFSTCAGVHIQADFLGVVNANVAYAITGNPTSAHANATAQGQIAMQGTTVTFTGSINFGIFALCSNLGLIYAASFTSSGGTLTGQKYNVASNGVVQSNGSTFPGPTAGSTATGGQYL